MSNNFLVTQWWIARPHNTNKSTVEQGHKISRQEDAMLTTVGNNFRSKYMTPVASQIQGFIYFPDPLTLKY